MILAPYPAMVNPSRDTPPHSDALLSECLGYVTFDSENENQQQHRLHHMRASKKVSPFNVKTPPNRNMNVAKPVRTNTSSAELCITRERNRISRGEAREKEEQKYRWNKTLGGG